MREDLEKRVDKAVELFMQGYNCSQAVTAAFADLYGLDTEMALRVSAGFGGGVGRLRMMCGAVSGMVLLAGLAEGQTEGDDRKGKTECYKSVRSLLDRFKEENYSVICAELLALAGAKTDGSHVPSERTAEYYKQRPCVAKVESAARIFAEYIESSQQ